MRLDRLRWDALPANTVEAITAGDKVTAYFMLNTIFGVTDRRAGRVKSMDSDRFRAENQFGTGGMAGVHQVPGHLGLTIYSDVFPAAQRVQINAVPSASEAKLNPAVNQAFGMKPRTDSGLIQ